MKRIFKKNQLIITALAALIAVAGYLNYTEKNINDKTKEASAKQQSTQSQNEYTDVSKNDNKDTSEDDKVSQVDGKDIESNDQDVQGTPGEAIFVNASGTIDFIVEAKMSKEYARVTMEESLQKIITNPELSDAEKKSAVDRMVAITENSEREMAAENLIMAKGFSDVVVTMTDGNVDVIIAGANVDSVTRAQIEDIVKRKMEVAADKITISVIDTNSKN